VARQPFADADDDDEDEEEEEGAGLGRWQEPRQQPSAPVDGQHFDTA
jgi:hypothetical protein